MSAKPDASPPQPTQEAYKPATREDTRNGLLVGVTCVIVLLVGLAIWRFGIGGVVGAAAPDTQVNALIIALAAPLMLIAAIYFFYVTWRDWKRSADFNQNKQRVRGTITHLWHEKNVKAWYAGYQYGDDMSAYQKVHKRRYDSLSVGDEVHVDYLPGDPTRSYFEPIRKRSSRKQANDT